MLPGAHQGNSDQSELFNSLKAHLNNRNRLQPFIGLSSIIECVNAGTRQRDAFFLCEVCVCHLGKADMRNHIMGSLHRYNYIKARHPDFASGWEEDSTLTKLAWPLMDIAKKIEEKEGPGTVQVIEFDKASYQQMECQRNNAENIIHFLRHILKEGDPETSETITSKHWEQTTSSSSSSSSQRIVLLSPGKKFEKSPKREVESFGVPNSYNSSPQSNTSLTRQTCDISQSFQSLEMSSLLSGYTGPVPLIGLAWVVEYKSEDGQTYCFLCHCCRVRSNKHDIIDHLTSHAHITNYLMETHPEQLESVDINDSYQLELLAQNLKQDEHTTALKVVQLPEPLCILMSCKSYHWCIKSLLMKDTASPVKHRNINGQKLLKEVQQGGPRKFDTVQPKRKKLKKRRPKNSPVFRVTLPVTQGSLLVERTSFSKDNLPLRLAYPPATDLDLSPQDFKLDNFSESFDITTENTEPDCYSQCQPNDMGFKNIQDMDFRDESINQFEEQNVDCKTHNESTVGLCKEDLHTAPVPTVFHNQNWPSDRVSCQGPREEGCAVGTPYYYQYPNLAPDYLSQQHADSSGHFDGGSRLNMNPQSGYSFPNNNSITITDHRLTQSVAGQSHCSYYTEYEASTHQYSSYQASSTGWGSVQSLASGQTQCYEACCLPAYTGAVFSNGISGRAFEATSPSATCYPMHPVSPHFYSTQGWPY